MKYVLKPITDRQDWNLKTKINLAFESGMGIHPL